MNGLRTEADEDREKGLVCAVAASLRGSQQDGASVVYAGMQERPCWMHSRPWKVAHELLWCRSPPSRAGDATLNRDLHHGPSSGNPVLLPDRSEGELHSAM